MTKQQNHDIEHGEKIGQPSSNSSDLSPLTDTEAVADKYARLSLIFGSIGLLAWILALLGVLVAITSIVLGVIGLRGTKRGSAVAGIILGGVCLLASICNSAVGYYRELHGHLPVAR